MRLEISTRPEMYSRRISAIRNWNFPPRACSLRARLFSFESMTLDWQLRCVVIRGKIA